LIVTDYILKDGNLLAQDGRRITPLTQPSQEQNDLEEAVYYETNLSENIDEIVKILSSHSKAILIIGKTNNLSNGLIHEFIDQLQEKEVLNPVLLRIDSHEPDHEKWMLESSVIASSFLLSGKIDGLWLNHPEFSSSELAFGILQATRKRISKTEYIACPSCGRTLFNIQEKLQEVKSKTSAFKGLKIAVMGCIVNGLGEMADADYGYVGAGKGKVNLYKGHELIIKNVDESEAADKLLEIINTNV